MANTAQVVTRIEPRDQTALGLLARRNNRSVAAEARVALIEHLHGDSQGASDKAADQDGPRADS